MRHVVFVGNPGAGKSTIANTLIGQVIFKSGIARGSGLTNALQSHSVGGIKYSDTPGLDDIERREHAAKEISNALNQSEELKLIFVCHLAEGRVRTDDVATIKVVLDAIEDTGALTSKKFVVVINKCTRGELELVKDAANAEYYKKVYSAGRELPEIFFVPEYESARGKENTVLPERNILVDIVNAAPVLTLKENVNVDVSGFVSEVERLRKEIEELQNQLNSLKTNGGAAASSSPTAWENVGANLLGGAMYGLGKLAIRKYYGL